MMKSEDLILRGIAGMHGTIEERQKTMYGVTGNRKPGDEFEYNGKMYVVCESGSLMNSGCNCACYECAMNGKCVKDFLYAAGECFYKWRKDNTPVYFKLKEAES